MRVVVTRRAEERLERAYDYGYFNFGLSAVARLQNELEEKLWLLRNHPYIGTKERLLDRSPLGYRYLILLKTFKLIYYVDTESGSVIISDLWDVWMEPSSLVEQTLSGNNQ